MKFTRSELESLARALIEWAEAEAAQRDIVKWRDSTSGEVVFYNPFGLRLRSRRNVQ